MNKPLTFTPLTEAEGRTLRVLQACGREGDHLDLFVVPSDTIRTRYESVYGVPLVHPNRLRSGSLVRCKLTESGRWVDGLTTPWRNDRDPWVAMKYVDMVRAGRGVPLLVTADRITLNTPLPRSK